MKYKNAKSVLPEWLFKELQQYVQGEMIYVPGNDSIRAGWGNPTVQKKSMPAEITRSSCSIGTASVRK